MKKILMAAALSGALLSGCKSTQLGSGTDDVYANPAEEKKLRQLASEEKAKQEAQEQERVRQEAAARKAAEDNNPYYKDPKYSADDYYDYAYASRLNRFSRPLYGAGYYDPYYTNMFTYNQNPAFYGTSIYSSYGYGMPSSMFNGYSMGISTGWGYGNYNCSPGWGYDPFYYSSGLGYGCYNGWGSGYGFGNSYYSGYNNGYYNGYYNGLNSSYWNGYYNKLDPNSGYGRIETGPRSSNGGSNAGRGGSNMLMQNNRSGYFESVAEEQARAQRFNTSERVGRENSQGRIQGEPGENGRRSFGGSQPSQSHESVYDNNDRGSRSNSSGRIQEENNGRGTQRQSQNQNTWNAPVNNNSGRGRSDNFGSQPRNSGGGGNTRPHR